MQKGKDPQATQLGLGQWSPLPEKHLECLLEMRSPRLLLDLLHTNPCCFSRCWWSSDAWGLVKIIACLCLPQIISLRYVKYTHLKRKAQPADASVSGSQ